MDAPNTPEFELPELSEENFMRLSSCTRMAFMFRALVRLMLLLGGVKQGLEFWPVKNQARHFTTMVAAIDLSFLTAVERVSFYNEADYSFYSEVHEAASDAVSDAYDTGVLYAREIARLARAAARTACGDDVDVLYSLNESAYGLHELSAVMEDIRDAYTAVNFVAIKYDLWRLLQLETVESSDISLETTNEFILSPLWLRPDGGSELPDNWVKIIERWKATMNAYHMDDMVDRYMSLVDGKPWDIDETEKRFNTWFKGHKDDLENNVFVKGIDPMIDAEFDEDGNPLDVPEIITQKKANDPNTIKTASIANPTGDHATTKDALGREVLVKALAAFLDHKEYKGQNTIGLLGHWGAGKSSVLNMLEDALSESPQNFNKPKTTYLTATFNAWAYEHTDNIQAGLAQEVVSGLTDKLGFWQRIGLARRFAKETQSLKYRVCVVSFLSVLLAAIVTGYLGEETWQSVGAAAGGLAATLFFIWKLTNTVFAHPLAEKLQTYLRLPSFGEHLGQIPVIQGQVRELCKLVLTADGRGGDGMIMTNDKRLLLMIDDLDRCGEEGIVKTLEAVKLVMDLPNVTTIIAVDHRMALAALSVHYHNLAEKGSERTAHAIARDYLGKILTLPIQLDTPGDDEIGEYLDKVLFVNLEEKPAPKEFKPAMPIEENNSGEPAKEEINSKPEGMESIDPIEPTGNVEHERVNAGQDSTQDFEEAIAFNKKQMMVDEVVKGSKEERDQFASLSKALSITNPRQLKRLHNSYRLLKALGFHQSNKVTGLEVGGYYHRLMTMLFWLEHISCLDKDVRKNEEDYMRISTSDRLIVDKLVLSVDRYQLLKEKLVPSFYDDFEGSKESYDKLKERVKVFMLPFADISKDVDTNHNNKQPVS